MSWASQTISSIPADRTCPPLGRVSLHLRRPGAANCFVLPTPYLNHVLHAHQKLFLWTHVGSIYMAIWLVEYGFAVPHTHMLFTKSLSHLSHTARWTMCVLADMPSNHPCNFFLSKLSPQTFSLPFLSLLFFPDNICAVFQTHPHEKCTWRLHSKEHRILNKSFFGLFREVRGRFLQVTLLPVDLSKGKKFMLFQDKTEMLSLTNLDVEELQSGVL